MLRLEIGNMRLKGEEGIVFSRAKVIGCPPNEEGYQGADGVREDFGVEIAEEGAEWLVGVGPGKALAFL